MQRVILHVDMNNCYASIETKLNPAYKDLPIAVCGSVENRHGIVLAKSQEAKVMGVKTGEAIWQAKQKCHGLLIVPPHYEEYLIHSRLARKIYYEYTNQIEAFGLDECWLDVTGSKDLFGGGRQIAEMIRERIKKELGITVSIGISFNKIFAKLGSDMKKPDAITEIPKGNFKSIVWKLPVEEMIGIGRATKKRLNQIGIYTLGELARTDPDLLKGLLGINGYYLWEHANGKDYRDVADRDAETEVKSIGRGITCREDLLKDEEVLCIFQELAFDVSKSLRENSFQAGGIQITIRDNKLYSRQYQCTLDMATQSSINLTKKAMELFKKRYNWEFPIRSLTIRAINLEKFGTSSQIDMFSDYKKYLKIEKLDTTIYEIKRRFGKDKLTFANLIRDIKMPKDRTDIVTLPNSMVR